MLERKKSKDLILEVEDHYSHFGGIVAKYPPKLGLRYLTGFWKIPWLIMPKWFGFKQIDKVKIKIAHNPRGDLACAYILGMLDAKDGKLSKKYLGSDATDILEITPEWFTKFGYEIPEKYKLLTKGKDSA